MKLFYSTQETLNILADNPKSLPVFILLMSLAHSKGRWEANEVYYNYKQNEILKNCRAEKMKLLLREVGYDLNIVWSFIEKEAWVIYEI